VNMAYLKIDKGKVFADSRYRWAYIIGKNARAARKNIKFKHNTRSGVVGSDWVSGNSWGSPILALAPPTVNFIERSGDSRLGLDVHKIDIFSRFGLVSSENRWAVIHPPP